ncbi:unnamed protein product [Angiostrongylus costaricensis]|uniref:Peptidase_M13 domain-containing protein n=1 Tax=Angiostrongylus costaricensis TaxID=334426 RepID=A0A0R3PB35_ANGCS|nr:unnamed protein product [Angiostrongylus costaricensis]
MDFESDLAEIMVATEDQRNHTEMYNLRRLSEMQALMPLVGISITTCVEFMEALPLKKDINKVDSRVANLLISTDSVIIANYVYVCYFLKWEGELGGRYEEVAKETKNATLEMVNHIQEAFHDMLVENDWIDSSTKASALDKARKIQRVIGYPDFILDDKELEDYHSELSILELDSYKQMTEKCIRWRKDLQFNRLMKALNYGGIGTVIGHEISHGFDDQVACVHLNISFEAKLEPTGYEHGERSEAAYSKQLGPHSLRGSIWSNILFVPLSSCRYVPEAGLYVNGKLTQGENIADHAGVKVAFKNYLKKFGEERRIRGLEEYNSEQMFFIGYATMFFRVNQVLANQEEFAAVFNCPDGTPMNPASRCTVW